MSETMAWVLFGVFIVATIALASFVSRISSSGGGPMSRLFTGKSDHDVEAARAAAQAHNAQNDGWSGML